VWGQLPRRSPCRPRAPSCWAWASCCSPHRCAASHGGPRHARAVGPAAGAGGAGPVPLVRNPMISGVVLVLCGEPGCLVSRPHAIWALSFRRDQFSSTSPCSRSRSSLPASATPTAVLPARPAAAAVSVPGRPRPRHEGAPSSSCADADESGGPRDTLDAQAPIGKGRPVQWGSMKALVIPDSFQGVLICGRHNGER